VVVDIGSAAAEGEGFALTARSPRCAERGFRVQVTHRWTPPRFGVADAVGDQCHLVGAGARVSDAYIDGCIRGGDALRQVLGGLHIAQPRQTARDAVMSLLDLVQLAHDGVHGQTKFPL
jgi:hypothetical protein